MANSGGWSGFAHRLWTDFKTLKVSLRIIIIVIATITTGFVGGIYVSYYILSPIEFRKSVLELNSCQFRLDIANDSSKSCQSSLSESSQILASRSQLDESVAAQLRSTIQTADDSLKRLQEEYKKQKQQAQEELDQLKLLTSTQITGRDKTISDLSSQLESLKKSKPIQKRQKTEGDTVGDELQTMANSGIPTNGAITAFASSVSLTAVEKYESGSGEVCTIKIRDLYSDTSESLTFLPGEAKIIHFGKYSVLATYVGYRNQLCNFEYTRQP
jgi:hypothetical protein